MSSPRPSHAPKLRALIAYDVDALSDAGRQRVERHLSDCASCQEALAQIRAYDVAASEVHQLPQPEVDWSQMELAIRRSAKAEAARIQGQRGSQWLTAAVLVAAAALAIIAAWPAATDSEPTVSNEVEPTPIVESEVESELVEATVVAVAGKPRRDGGEAERSEASEIRLGDRLEEAETVELQRGALHARIGDQTAFALEGSGQLRLARLRQDGVELALLGGRVANQVKTGNAYAVLVEPYRFMVQGTRFEVLRDGDAVAITVSEGIVEVLREDESIAVLHAPATWSSSPTFAAPVADEVIVPRGAVDMENWAALHLPENEKVESWELLERRWPQSLSLMAPLGSYEVVGFGPNGERYEATIELLAEGAELEERALRRVRAQPRAGALTTEQIQAVVAPQHRRLRHCYELEDWSRPIFDFRCR